jgi:outer membrane protein assembly factor BamB
LPYLNTFGRYYDQTYDPDPYDRSYNQVHIPGASAYGANYVATADKVYVAQQQGCLVLDAATGETIAEFGLPATADSEARNWGYIGVYQDLLIAGAAPLEVSKQEGKLVVELNQPFAPGSRYVVVMNRHSGKALWEREAAYSFRHNTIVAGNGKLFCIDAMPKESMELMKRRGIEDQTRPEILALDIRTGRELWSVADNVFGTWLGYSQEHDVLLQAGSRAGDRAEDEVGEGMSAYAAGDGTLLWASDREYAGPCILYHDKIITQAQTQTRPPPPANAFELLTGELVMRTHPLTGEEVPWGWTRLYGCNTAIASEHMLTFRSASAAYSDLWTGQGMTSIGGFKTGCTSNLVAADGVLNSPDYTRTCTCSYQNQTSLALYHMPTGDPSSIDVEGWSFNSFPAPAIPAAVKHVGINLGAPGDRLADNGVLWLEYPSVGGLSPDIPVHIQADHPQLFRYHMSYMKKNTGAQAEGTLAWVAASGIEGLTAITIWPLLQPAGPAVEEKAEDFVPCYDAPESMTCIARVGRHAGDPLPDRPITVSGRHEVPWRYAVRLHFVELRDLAPGERRFDVLVQGKKVLDDFDIVKAAGGTRTAVVVELSGIEVKTDLRIVMKPSRPGLSHGPLLCGIELAAEE